MTGFTYDWYSDFLRHCRDNGNLTLLRDVETGAFPQIILRHDIDFDLAAAQEFSLKEEGAGVRSTYLVLLSTHYYNPASPITRSGISQLQLKRQATTGGRLNCTSRATSPDILHGRRPGGFPTIPSLRYRKIRGRIRMESYTFSRRGSSQAPCRRIEKKWTNPTMMKPYHNSLP